MVGRAADIVYHITGRGIAWCKNWYINTFGLFLAETNIWVNYRTNCYTVCEPIIAPYCGQAEVTVCLVWEWGGGADIRVAAPLLGRLITAGQRPFLGFFSPLIFAPGKPKKTPPLTNPQPQEQESGLLSFFLFFLREGRVFGGFGCTV